MPWSEALRTLRATSFGRHGYLAAGPLIVEELVASLARDDLGDQHRDGRVLPVD